MSSAHPRPDAATELERLRSGGPDQQDAAFACLMAATDEPVGWAYDAWDDLVALLSHPSNRTRAIAAQVLCNLAKSDPQERMVNDLDHLLAVTRDERFVTARHCLQSLWKVGAAGERQRRRLLDGLRARFRDCAAEKNRTLVRYDIVESLQRIYGSTGDEEVRERALEWIQEEEDPKYRKKYARVWSARQRAGSGGSP